MCWGVSCWENDALTEWRRRLKHINFNIMRFLNLKIPSGLKCKVVVKGKQPRLPFADWWKRAGKKHELMLSEVDETIFIKSKGACRLTWLSMKNLIWKVSITWLCTKNQVFECFARLNSTVENLTEPTSKKFRANSDGKFDSDSFKVYFE